jgi:hypothetical protein
VRAEHPGAVDELAAIEEAIQALEGQRGMLGEAVLETALQPLRDKRDAVLSGLEVSSASS